MQRGHAAPIAGPCRSPVSSALRQDSARRIIILNWVLPALGGIQGYKIQNHEIRGAVIHLDLEAFLIPGYVTSSAWEDGSRNR